MDILWQLLIQALLIALNAVFACAEIAVISINDAKLTSLKEQGDKRALASLQANRPTCPLFGDHSSGYHAVRLLGQCVRGG